MASKKLKQDSVDDSTIKLVRWEIVTRTIQVKDEDPEAKEGDMVDVEQKLITGYVQDAKQRNVSHRQVLDSFLTAHSLDEDTVTLDEVETYVLSDLIAAKYE